MTIYFLFFIFLSEFDLEMEMSYVRELISWGLRFFLLLFFRGGLFFIVIAVW